VRTPSESPGTDLCSTKSIFCALSADCAPCAIVTRRCSTVAHLFRLWSVLANAQTKARPLGFPHPGRPCSRRDRRSRHRRRPSLSATGMWLGQPNPCLGAAWMGVRSREAVCCRCVSTWAVLQISGQSALASPGWSHSATSGNNLTLESGRLGGFPRLRKKYRTAGGRPSRNGPVTADFRS
jgi:hypothetical protein